MRDHRIKKLAQLVVNHSCRLAQGEKVWIEAIGVPNHVVIEIMRAANSVGATPFLSLKDDQAMRELCCLYDAADINVMADCELYALKKMDSFIGIRGLENIHELSDVPPDRIQNIWRHYIQPVHLEHRNVHLKWVVLRWPTPSMAQRACMSTEAFEDAYFKACILDYAKMEKAMTPLTELMGKTDKIRIIGPADLRTRIYRSRYAIGRRSNTPGGITFQTENSQLPL